MNRLTTTWLPASTCVPHGRGDEPLAQIEGRENASVFPTGMGMPLCSSTTTTGTKWSRVPHEGGADGGAATQFLEVLPSAGLITFPFCSEL